jgi:hypothetical protein
MLAFSQLYVNYLRQGTITVQLPHILTNYGTQIHRQHIKVLLVFLILMTTLFNQLALENTNEVLSDRKNKFRRSEHYLSSLEHENRSSPPSTVFEKRQLIVF